MSLGEITIILHAHGGTYGYKDTLPKNVRLFFPIDPKKRATLCTTPEYFKNMCSRSPELTIEPGNKYPDFFIQLTPRVVSSYSNGIYECGDNTKKVQIDLDEGIGGETNFFLSDMIDFILQLYPERIINLWVATCASSMVRTPVLRDLDRIRTTHVTKKTYYNNQTGETLSGFYDGDQAIQDINTMNSRLRSKDGPIWKSYYDKAKSEGYNGAYAITFAELKLRYGWDDAKAFSATKEVQDLRNYNFNNKVAGRRKTKRIKAKSKH